MYHHHDVARNSPHMVAERGHAPEPSAEKTVGSRQLAWRPTTRVDRKEKSKSNEQQAAYTREYAVRVDAALQKISDGILALIDKVLIPSESAEESKMPYYKMKDDNYRHFAELATCDAKSKAAQDAYAEAPNVQIIERVVEVHQVQCQEVVRHVTVPQVVTQKVVRHIPVSQVQHVDVPIAAIIRSEGGAGHRSAAVSDGGEDCGSSTGAVH